MADKASDLGTVAIEKVSLVRRQFESSDALTCCAACIN